MYKRQTFTVEADNKAAAKSRLSRIETAVFNNFKVLGVTARPLSGYFKLPDSFADSVDFFPVDIGQSRKGIVPILRLLPTMR